MKSHGIQTFPLIDNKVSLPHFKLSSYLVKGFHLSGTMDDTTPPPPANDAPAPPPPVTTSGSPTDFLKGVVGKRVVVRLTSGVDYRGVSHNRFLHHSHTDLQPFHSGVLSCLDGYMNIALEQTEEHVNGRVLNRYGDAFIRGNNGTLAASSLIRLPPDIPLFQSSTSQPQRLCEGRILTPQFQSQSHGKETTVRSVFSFLFEAACMNTIRKREESCKHTIHRRRFGVFIY